MDVLIDIDDGFEKISSLPLEELTHFVLEHEGISPHVEVSLSFVSNEVISELNETYRNKRSPTDVLSFECDSEDEFEEATMGSFSLGDVVIAPDIALSQAKDYGVTFEEEINLLLVHGLLHLCGYDHIKDEEAEEMESLERSILSQWSERER